MEHVLGLGSPHFHQQFTQSCGHMSCTLLSRKELLFPPSDEDQTISGCSLYVPLKRKPCYWFGALLLVIAVILLIQALLPANHASIQSSLCCSIGKLWTNVLCQKCALSIFNTAFYNPVLSKWLVVKKRYLAQSCSLQ